jgi:hypothetical protein
MESPGELPGLSCSYFYFSEDEETDRQMEAACFQSIADIFG